MTVLQNIVLGHEPTDSGWVDTDTARSEIETICDRYDFDIDDHLDTQIGNLDLGVRQRVEIVKSLYRGAEILIFDEPTAVLTPQEVDGLFELMNELRDRGTSMIFITHKLEEAMEIADEITVLRDGSRIGTVSAEEATKEQLAEMMVGREVLFEYDARDQPPDEPVLEVDSLEVVDERGLASLRDVSFDIRAGEIFGIAGVQGNGQSELVAGLTGLHSVDDGTIRFQGDDITEIGRREAIERGVSFIPEDRHEEGMVLDYDLTRNALLGFQTIAPFSEGGILRWNRVREHADQIISDFDVRPPDRRKQAGSFSGGNQQKFIVGRELSHDPELLVASHPTRGVDIGSIEFIHQQLLEMRDAGLPILLVSSKLEEVQKLADRIGVMYEGALIDIVEPDEVTEQELGLLMAGESRAARDTQPPAVGDGGEQ
jgi:simple sugar transport system ATP-binding protein